MARKKLRIVSDGTAEGTEVFCGNEKIDGITSIVIEDIKPAKLVKVTISVINADLDIFAGEYQTEQIGGIK